MNFYIHVSNTRCHSIESIKYKNSKNQYLGTQSREMGKSLGREFWRGVLNLERNIGKEAKFRVSGGSEFQSYKPMIEKALLPSNEHTYGMERTSELEDLVETECDGNERLLWRNVGCWFVGVLYVRRQGL